MLYSSNVLSASSVDRKKNQEPPWRITWSICNLTLNKNRTLEPPMLLVYRYTDVFFLHLRLSACNAKMTRIGPCNLEGSCNPNVSRVVHTRKQLGRKRQVFLDAMNLSSACSVQCAGTLLHWLASNFTSEKDHQSHSAHHIFIEWISAHRCFQVICIYVNATSIKDGENIPPCKYKIWGRMKQKSSAFEIFLICKIQKY